MHYYVDEKSKRGYKNLSEEWRSHEIVELPERVDWFLNTKGMSRYNTHPLNIKAGMQPVTALFKQWGEPAHGITGWYNDANLWVTYCSTPHADIAAYYHIQNVKTGWMKMCSETGLVVPTLTPWEGHMQRCDYLQYEEGSDSFKLQYGYTTPGNFVKTVKVWFKRSEPGKLHQWHVSHITGRDRNEFKHLIGWSF